MTAPDETGNGPVIRDNRRIDPVTGQPRRGKHAATSPAGTSGAGRPGGTSGSPPGGRHGKGNGADAGAGADKGTEPTDSAQAGPANNPEGEAFRTPPPPATPCP